MRPKGKITILFLFPLFLFSISACGAGTFTTSTATSASLITNTLQPTLSLTSTKTILPTKIPTPTITPNPDLIKDFAGIYHKAEYSYKCSLEMSRNSTFKLNFQNTLNGITLNANGVVSYSGVQLLLTQTEADANILTDYRCFPEALVPIYWGERRYLFMTNDNNDDGVFSNVVSFFCDDLRNGLEPRNNIDDINGLYFLRETDITTKVSGFPVRIDHQLICP